MLHTIQDHDDLIALKTHMDLFCKKLDKFHSENREDHKVLGELIASENLRYDSVKEHYNSKLDTKLNWSIFSWVVGFIILGLISLSSYTVAFKDVATARSFDNKAKIEYVIKKHITDSEATRKELEIYNKIGQ